LLIFFLYACSTRNSDSVDKSDSVLAKRELKPSTILLTESELGKMELDKLSKVNLIGEVNTHFPQFQVSKELGQQDGPNFDLYEITEKKERIFFIAMKYDNESLVDYLTIESRMIEDVYGLRVGSTTSQILKNRPDLEFFADLHFNVYAASKGSRIQYRLKGDLLSLNDSTFVAEDFSVSEWQVEAMEIEYLIWRK
jgi:hypothetical protein